VATLRGTLDNGTSKPASKTAHQLGALTATVETWHEIITMTLQGDGAFVVYRADKFGRNARRLVGGVLDTTPISRERQEDIKARLGIGPSWQSSGY
jgi:hypothetical protein